MNIECKLKRQGGTKVELGGKEYHFEPRADGRHVAFVEDEAHRDRLLSISEAYRVAVDVPAPAKIELPKPAAAPVVETVTYPDGTVATGVAPLPTQSPTEQAGEQGADEPPADTSELRALLVTQYKEKFGKAPHGKWTVEKITEELNKVAE